MQTKVAQSFDDLVEQLLGERLPEGLTDNLPMSKLPPDTRNFIMRTLTLMKKAGYSATGFNPHLIQWLTVTVPSVLPSAWGGQIPPLTLPGRHKKLDNYVANLTMDSAHEPPAFLDLGCGFPPATAADTARDLRGWHVYGVDRSFADYVLYDSDGHYACFDQNGAFKYFQAFTGAAGRELYANPEATRLRFTELFEALLPLLKNSNGAKSETVEKNGCRLIHHHIRDFETDNLTLIKSDFEDLDLPPVNVIRCMNVLIYFKSETRKKMLARAGDLLADEGIMIVGTNGLGIQTRYAVYKKKSGGLSLDEFAFSMDNIGHIVFMSFFTIHENDEEAALLAELTGVIRADKAFWPEFSLRQDELLKQHGICRRQPDGFLLVSEDEMPPPEYIKRMTLLWQQLTEEGYLDQAADALKAAGYDAYINSVGDIAVRPPIDFISPS
jgi:hypothetical protein